MNPLDEQIKKADGGASMSFADFCKAENEYVKAAAVVIALLEEKARLRATPSCPTCKNYERKGEPEKETVRLCTNCIHFSVSVLDYPCHKCVRESVGQNGLAFLRGGGDYWAEKPEKKPEGNCETCVSRFRPGHLEPCVNCTRLPKAICTKANRMDHYKEKTT